MVERMLLITTWPTVTHTRADASQFPHSRGERD